jgi:hypothetical protein
MMTATTGHTPDFDPTALLHTDADVLRRVDALIDSTARISRSLWLFFLSGDGAQLPVVVPIDNLPPSPDPLMMGNVFSVVAGIITTEAPGGSAIVTLTRPGAGDVEPTDRPWLRTMQAAARKRGAAIRMLCLATPAGVCELR